MWQLKQQSAQVPFKIPGGSSWSLNFDPKDAKETRVLPTPYHISSTDALCYQNCKIARITHWQKHKPVYLVTESPKQSHSLLLQLWLL